MPQVESTALSIFVCFDLESVLKKLTIYFAVVLSGLTIGYIGRSALEPDIDRVKSATNLVRSYCLPIARGDWNEPSAELVRLSDQTWADAHSRVMLKLSNNRCDVSDILEHFNHSERDDFARSVEALVVDEFPMLAPDLNHGLNSWDLFKVWAQYDRGDPKRWGAGISRFSRSGENAQTSFWLLLPRS